MPRSLSDLCRRANLTNRLRLGFLVLALLLIADADSSYGQETRLPLSKACDRAAFRVALDVGHTTEEPGAISARGRPEYEFNLELAEGIKTALMGAGFTRTALLVTSGQGVRALAGRVTHANGLNTDLFLSVHHDSVPERFLESWTDQGRELRFSDRFKGHSLFVSFGNVQRIASIRFARLLGAELKTAGLPYARHYAEPFMREKRRQLLDGEAGVYRFDALRVLRTAKMPAVLLEAGSIIHRTEELDMASAERRATLARAVVNAVERFCASSVRE